ncbi:MAG: AAA family ATPase [Caldilineaceae bacterium]|nr:AAA family ATPase [Caldilineaceae bacterium]
MNLFEQAREDRLEKEAPLAARMRPRLLDEFIGQEAIIGPGRLLRRAIQADRLSSLIFYGPPGTGKTTLARVIANTTAAHFTALNAVLAGVKDIREAVQEAQERLALHDQRTILFIDEVHRFNKAQQDALLPWVENGTVIFIGATTENPYFEVNKALVSRSRIFQLKPLTEDHLRQVARQALADPERGYGTLNVQIDDDALDHLVNVANGDARALLNALELAVETTKPRTIRAGSSILREDGPAPGIHITLPIAEESIQRRAVLYDKEGDAHFDTISAFIKSLRGSDPDAALYWLAKMVYAGEEPRFIFRRMLIFASEDVGMADPQAVQVVAACAESFDRVGLPEGQFPLAQAAIYLATAQKSNSVFAFFDALETVQNEPEQEVPSHLRDANRDKKGFGHGEGYLYPHAYREHWVAQQYLPDLLQGKLFYQPTAQGYESEIRAQVSRRREAQLAAMVEESGAPAEILTFSPDDPARDRWLQRTISGVGEEMAQLRDQLLAVGPLPRHAVLLDLNAGSGLITWEAVRRLPEGGVYALVRSETDFSALQERSLALPEIERPLLIHGEIPDLLQLLAAQEDLRFDAIVGRNALLTQVDKEAALAILRDRLQPDGWLALAERISRRTQRLYDLVDLSNLPVELIERVIAAEEAIYTDPVDALVNWDETSLQKAAEVVFQVERERGQVEITLEVEKSTAEIHVTQGLLMRWFGDSGGDRPSYAARLRKILAAAEIETLRQLFIRQLLNRNVNWQSQTAIVQIRRVRNDA